MTFLPIAASPQHFDDAEGCMSWTRGSHTYYHCSNAPHLPPGLVSLLVVLGLVIALLALNAARKPIARGARTVAGSAKRVVVLPVARLLRRRAR